MKTALDLSASHAQATARDLDDMSFNVPPHSLDRCTRVSMRLTSDSDPAPQLSAEFNPRLIWQGCEGERQMAISSRRSLDVIGMHFTIDTNGHVTDVRILDKVGAPEEALQNCLLANARRSTWPANRNGKPYEKHVFNVLYYTDIGTTTWRMIDTVRQLAEPRRAMCECLREHSPAQALEFEASFTLPATVDTTHVENLVVTDTSPMGQCVADTIRNEVFEARGGVITVNYKYHIDPADPAQLESVKAGQIVLPTDSDEPLVSVLR